MTETKDQGENLDAVLADLANRFTYHPPAREHIPVFERIRETGHSFAELLVELTPPGREQSLAITKIEEVVMWANAALARSRPVVQYAETAKPEFPGTIDRAREPYDPKVKQGDSRLERRDPDPTMEEVDRMYGHKPHPSRR